MTAVDRVLDDRVPGEQPWRRLDPRMLVVGPLGSLARLVPLVLILLVTGGTGDPVRLWIAAVAAGVVVLAGIVRWRTTKYRITPDRVELHTGWLRRQRRSVPRDRIRTVDLTARLLHRAFGLSVVQVGAASGSPLESAGLSLDAVSTAEADLLRRELLDRSGPVPRQEAPPGELLARLDWSWLRFAPLTFSSIAGIGAIGATLFNALDDLGVDPRDIGAVDDAAGRFTSAPIWLGVLVVAGVLLVLAVVGALLLYAERWYDYRLTREADGTLRVERGLLTRRSLSVAEQRLRGAEVVEPLLLRCGRGGQTRALSTGLSRDAQGGALLPPAPRAEAHRVASATLRAHPAEITGAALRRHPAAARTRRLTRTLVPTAVVCAGAFLLGPGWAGPASLLLLPLAVLLGLDRYAQLGHELTARYLVARQGSLVRTTVALQRDGVIGWTVRQSVFQRRAGVVTVEAVTAAGQGGYPVLDVAAADGVALADAAVPGMLTPFLHRTEDPRWPAS
ncbi:PH domain-containing protein [Pseudonocardia petroleophila]|uniref:PH domain-containing protein n=1 Tax=Pseudonocardia petroleophila TaxID=37331 RepID=A0A7G7MIH8_9PSEU|nr:PH domain-containing protein [Pseudonocardia petroleophila]QNG52589.1 PH domain-containing protein [Pseudonocardia petroleophila]